MSSTSALTERISYRSPAPLKNQQEFSNLLLTTCGAIHEVLDSILSGIVEPPAPSTMGTHRTRNIVETHLLAGDPVTALTPLATRQLEVLRRHPDGPAFLVNTALLIGPWRRLLAVQDSTPTRDSRIPTHKAHLPRLHALAWNQLARLASKTVGARAGGGQPFGGGDLSSLLEIFLKGRGEFLLTGPASSPSYSSSSSLLASIWRYLTVRPEEGIPHARKLLQLALACLSLDNCQLEGSVITESDRKRGLPFDGKKSSLGEKRGKIDKSKGTDRRGGMSTGGGADTNKTAREINDGRWPPHMEACIQWVEAAAKCPRLIAALPNAGQLTLFITLINIISQSGIGTGKGTNQKAQLLRAMGALVLYRQPATLSPALPLFLGLLRGFLHDRSGHMEREIRLIALDLARSVDLLIRPRRPYPLTRASWKEEVGVREEEIVEEKTKDKQTESKEEEREKKGEQDRERKEARMPIDMTDANADSNAGEENDLTGDNVSSDAKSMSAISDFPCSSPILVSTDQARTRDQVSISVGEKNRPSLSLPPRPEGDDDDLPHIVDELSD